MPPFFEKLRLNGVMCPTAGSGISEEDSGENSVGKDALEGLKMLAHGVFPGKSAGPFYRTETIMPVIAMFRRFLHRCHEGMPCRGFGIPGGIPTYLGNRAGAKRHDRTTASHRLKRGHSETLAPGREYQRNRI